MHITPHHAQFPVTGDLCSQSPQNSQGLNVHTVDYFLIKRKSFPQSIEAHWQNSVMHLELSVLWAKASLVRAVSLISFIEPKILLEGRKKRKNKHRFWQVFLCQSWGILDEQIPAAKFSIFFNFFQAMNHSIVWQKSGDCWNVWTFPFWPPSCKELWTGMPHCRIGAHVCP